MKKIGNFVMKLVAIALALTVFVSCGNSKNNSSKNNAKENLGDVSVYSFYEPHFDSNDNSTGQAAKKYEELYGGKAKVTVLPYADYASTLQNMIAAGNQPDMVSVYWGDMPNWAITILQPVDDYIDVSKLNLQNLVEAYSFNNKHYTLTVQQVQAQFLWFNKTIFERYGIEKTPYDLWKEDNWTWDTFSNLAKELTQDTDGDGKTDLWGFISNDPQMFHYSNSAPFITVSGNKASLIWNSKASINAFKMYQKMLFEDKTMNPDGEQVHSGAFESEKAAMAYGTFEFPLFRSSGMDLENIGVAPFPTGPDFDGKYYATTNFFGLVQGAKNPKGAAKLSELIDEMGAAFPMGFDLGNTDATQLLTDEQMEVIKSVTKDVNLAMDRGWGNFINPFISVYTDIAKNQNITTVLDTYSQVANAEINDTVERLEKSK